jgi:hypothetical protein
MKGDGEGNRRENIGWINRKEVVDCIRHTYSGDIAKAFHLIRFNSA